MVIIKELIINRICYTQLNDPQYGMDDHNQYIYIHTQCFGHGTYDVIMGISWDIMNISVNHQCSF